ncbi:Hypothetical protein PHPALM_11955 [Phytophthora palmivora]|uniref:Uncharacterized protein n=1 Tax=Phytophthora palmivora TaxID=4796 RepID=A0A2P4Y0Y1_9STRA|nr:Hypothetical protein PHPALM_11955 [Phytophthora palmivora]
MLASFSEKPLVRGVHKRAGGVVEGERGPMFYPMERDDSANTINVIEEGDEQDLNAEAFADMAMSNMDMGLELNSLQIRAFLARNEAQNESSNGSRETQSQNKLSAYEVLRNGAVHYSRREDKMKALQEHPVVNSVSSDGRTVGCKCGRNVKLNPPWYILKFEQHVASRNCTFLRQSRPNTKKRKRTEVDTRTEQTESADRTWRQEHGSRTQSGETRVEGVTRNQGGTSEAVNTSDRADGDEESSEYILQSVDTILRREFGAVENGQTIIVPPPENSPDDRVRMFKGAVTLRENPHFKHITPDGRFAECKCSRIILLSAPWQPGQFLMHVADKQKPKKRAKPVSVVVTNGEWKKKKISPSGAERAVISTGVLTKPPTLASALLQAHKNKKSFPREIRWDVAQARGLLPCPGLRDERMNTFVTSAIQLTGGARHRQKIARELFPHLFPENMEYNHTAEADHTGDLEHSNGQISSKKRQPKLQQQLLEAEKLLLHDVIEGEALWFVDKDGNSIEVKSDAQHVQLFELTQH